MKGLFIVTTHPLIRPFGPPSPKRGRKWGFSRSSWEAGRRAPGTGGGRAADSAGRRAPGTGGGPLPRGISASAVTGPLMIREGE
jgi:hypothetical protein